MKLIKYYEIPFLDWYRLGNTRRPLNIDIDYKQKKELYACAYVLAGIKYTVDLMLESVTYKKIIEKGIIKGKEEGKIEGKIEGKEDSIIYFLRARFKKIPARITKKIRAIKEDSTLEHLIIAAATSNSIEEFEKHIKA